MSPVAVFIRTLLKSSAIFIGAAAIFLHPSLEWRPAAALGGGTSVGAQQSGSEAAVDALIIALKDSDAGVRREAARALAQMDSRRPALAASLSDSDPQIRASVASALGEIGDASAVDALVAAVKDKVVDVRRRVVGALGEIGDARALDALTQALKDEDAGVRRAAASAIAEIGGTSGPHPHPHPHPHPVVVRTVVR